MGHSWREMDPAGVDERDNAINKQIKLRDFLKTKPLSDFTVEELPMLIRIMNADSYERDIRHFSRKFKLKL